jgi:hypothetical protein
MHVEHQKLLSRAYGLAKGKKKLLPLVGTPSRSIHTGI